MIESIKKCPSRSPEAVSVAIKDIIAGKNVCELGCAEGDNLAFMARFAATVFGIDRNPRRYKYAIERGFTVLDIDYKANDLPVADVYYAWPDKVKLDCPILLEKAKNLKHHGTMIVAGDGGYATEEYVIKDNAKAFGGRVIEVPFDEGKGYRENGTFYLVVLEF